MTPLRVPIIMIIVLFPYSLYFITFSLYGRNISDGTWHAGDSPPLLHFRYFRFGILKSDRLCAEVFRGFFSALQVDASPVTESRPRRLPFVPFSNLHLITLSLHDV